MSQRFDVLSRHENIHQNRLLEASAGTGKTFSIENLVVRLLIEDTAEGEPPCIEEVLVVTFTRAATRELFQRIRENIEVNVERLRSFDEDSYPDYLHSVDRDLALKRLEQALYCFDAAPIFTIHGFCSRVLREQAWEGGYVPLTPGEGESAEGIRIRQLVRDFFRTELDEKLLSATQLHKLIRVYGADQLMSDLSRVCADRFHLAPGRSFHQLHVDFARCMEALQHLDSQAVVREFEESGIHFKGISNRGKIRPEMLESVQFFSSLLQQSTWSDADLNRLLEDELVAFRGLVEGERYAKAPNQIDCPHAESILKSLGPIVEWGSEPLRLFATLAFEAQAFVKQVADRREIVGPDQLLERMAKALEDEGFVESVRRQYRVAIIDEFQDTDPLQWEIFGTLFCGHRLLYLVGDPKQSIYRFRSADIYTYLQAGKALGPSSLADLDTNFRSQPALVKALNSLFCEENCPGWIALPRGQGSMTYPEVKASTRVAAREFADDRGVIHFFAAEGELGRNAKRWPSDSLEEKELFPFIAAEILSLKDVPLACQAVLVRDHRQADRLVEVLRSHGISCITRRGASLLSHPARRGMRDFLEALLAPRDLSRLKVALGGTLFAWTDQDLSGSEGLSEAFSTFFNWRQVLYRDGFASCWMAVQEAYGQKVLGRLGGEGMWSAYQQIAELLMEQESRGRPEALLRYIDSWDELDGDSRFQLRQDPTGDAVQVMTIHVSKGLEFDVVYALGLLRRSSEREELMPCFRDGKEVLMVVDPKGEDARVHAEEEDAEKMRQLYVAMTRAKYRLYVPLAIEKSQKPTPASCASAMDLFLARFGREACTYDALYPRIQSETGEKLFQFIEQHPDISWSWARDYCLSDVEARRNTETLVPPPQPSVSTHPVLVRSFTSLAHDRASVLDGLEPPHDFGAERKSAATLPAGSKIGIILHKLLEDIPHSLAESDYEAFIDPYVAQTELEPWIGVLARMTYLSLHCELPDLGCSLSEVTQFWNEPDFLYHLPEGGFDRLEGEAYLRGVMDVFFEYGGRYYLLDWKSNWLGPEASDYDAEALDEEMRRHDYLLQASIYTEALRRYLKLVDGRPFEDCFGGVYYVFIRGLEAGQGVVHLREGSVCAANC